MLNIENALSKEEVERTAQKEEDSEVKRGKGVFQEAPVEPGNDMTVDDKDDRIN